MAATLAHLSPISVAVKPIQIPSGIGITPITGKSIIPIMLPKHNPGMHQNTPLDARALPIWSSSCSSATTSRMIVPTFNSAKHRNLAPISV